MISTLRLYQSPGFDPHENLATEQYLLETAAPGSCTLYLWQNKNTVVIGKNQNAWAECRVGLLEAEGGKLARRLSGGGAVFHDLGNLNFTFILRDEDYDLDRQLSVIQTACALAGIRTERSGRNDVLAQGRKFSGNAFYHHAGRAYHHGTLLIRSDMDKLQRYLSPPKAKLEAKGVSSVRSRVINLSELAPELTCEAMKAHMISAFETVYGLHPESLVPGPDAEASIALLAKKNASWDHLFGNPLPFTTECSQYFPWGTVQIQLQVKAGTVIGVKVYSDAMDWTLPGRIEGALTDCRLRSDDIQRALHAVSDPVIRQDLCGLLREQLL